MKRFSKKLSVVVVLSLLSLVLLISCGGGDDDSPTSSSSVSVDDIGVIFTGNDDFAVAAAHKNGERLIVRTETDALGNITNATGAVWISPEGENLVVSLADTGLPEHAVMGDTVFLFANYTIDTVDVAVIDSEGNYTITRNVSYDSSLTALSRSFKLTARISRDDYELLRDTVEVGFGVLCTIKCVVSVGAACPLCALEIMLIYTAFEAYEAHAFPEADCANDPSICPDAIVNTGETEWNRADMQQQSSIEEASGVLDILFTPEPTPTPAPSVPNIAGSWTLIGRVTSCSCNPSAVGYTETILAEVTQSGTSITITPFMYNTVGTGSIDSNGNLSVSANVDSAQVTATGTANSTGTSMAGTYTITEPGCVTRGTFTGSR